MSSNKPQGATPPKPAIAEATVQQASFKNALVLSIFALISTGLVAVTYLFTKDKIAKAVELSMVRQLNQIVPSNKYNNPVYEDCIVVSDLAMLGTDDDQNTYRMRMTSATVNGSGNANVTTNVTTDYGLMLTSVAPDGYSGRIDIAVALSNAGDILGVNILSHQETPGLGDKIERRKSDWLNQFSGMSLNTVAKKNWQVKKDGGQFDALTGATITPRAVVKAVHNSLLYYQLNKDALFSQASNCGGKDE